MMHAYPVATHKNSEPLMAFKWNDHDQKLPRVLALMVEWWEPLFGHTTSSRTKHSCQTYWVMLRRRNQTQDVELCVLTG